jgi:glycerol kinase
MRYLLALDQGTTSSRSILVDENGRLLNTRQQEFAQHFPHPGWVEHDPEAIWKSQIETARACIEKIDPADIAAIGITNQRETTVLWNRKTGRAIAPAIVWQDRRTAKFCDQLRTKNNESMFRNKTGLLLDPYFSGTKIRWLLDHVPGAKAQANRGELAFGTIDSWLVWKLTKGARHITDITNASRTLMFNLETGTWDEELLETLGISKSLLPEVVSSSGELAVTDAEWFGRPVPITGIAGDQQAALFGQACFEPGMIKNTYGTGCFLLLNTGNTPVFSKNKLLTTPAWRLNTNIGTDQRDVGSFPSTAFALEGSVFTGGSVVQWLRDGLGLIKRSAAIGSLAESVGDTGGVVMVPAFTGLGAPVWDASARGLIIGITRGTTSAHIARAALESIAYQVADVVDCMQKDSAVEMKELRVDGGASVNNVLMQLQADLLGKPVVRPRNTESTAMGAAYLAGLGAGIWSSTNELAALWKAKQAMSADERKSKRSQWLKARDRAMNWAE